MPRQPKGITVETQLTILRQFQPLGLDGLTRLVNLTSACLNQPSVGSGCKVITQDADNFDEEI